MHAHVLHGRRGGERGAARFRNQARLHAAAVGIGTHDRRREVHPKHSAPAQPYRSFGVKTIGTCMCVGTSRPPFWPGLNRHLLTAITAGASNSAREERMA